MNDKQIAIKKAIDFFDGTQSTFARILNISRAQVWQWMNGKNDISAKRAIEIERLTKGCIRCEDLRPDINWSVIRGEKATKKAATAK